MTERKDHCSCWFDGNWGDICEAHDKAYAEGGNHFDRWRADLALGWGVMRKAHWYTLPLHIPMGLLMFGGVRIFASRPVSWLTRRMLGRQHRFNWGRRRKDSGNDK